jgi:hypothetical protein
MPFSTTYIKTLLSRYVGKQIKEGRCVDCIAIDIPALA